MRVGQSFEEKERRSALLLSGFDLIDHQLFNESAAVIVIMDVTFSDDNTILDSDTAQKQVQIAADETSLKDFQKRVEGILNLSRLTTGLDLFFASHKWNPLGLAPSSIVVCE